MQVCWYAMIWVMNERREDNGENHGLNDLAHRLREAVSRPLDEWREVYEGFSPVVLETGERRPRVPPPGADTRRAAVLVPILVEGDDARVVYTVRKDDLADHAGQISFPGGSIEARDTSLLETALREAEEEIDLRPELVEVVGELEEMYIPPSNFRVSPFVGLLPPEAEMVLAPDEVEEIFTVSLTTLTADETFRKVLWRCDGRDNSGPPGTPGLAGIQALGGVMLRVVAMVLFGLMFLAEAGDLYGLVLTLADPVAEADRFGITASAEILRSAVLLILALVVCSGALLALVGLLARMPALFHTSALVCAIGYLVYGLFQVVDGALQLGSAIVVVAGLIYVVLGGIAYAMYRSVY